MISGYRLMWLMVMFDLPVETKENRRDYRRFVEKLEDDGYTRAQFSVYVRPCATDENTATHQGRLIEWLPPEGEVRVLKFTDKQWGRMMVYRERSLESAERAPEQFSFFDDDGAVLVDEVNGPDVVRREQLIAAETVAPYDSGKTSVMVGGLASALTKLAGKAEQRKRKGKKVPKPSTPSFDFFE